MKIPNEIRLGGGLYREPSIEDVARYCAYIADMAIGQYTDMENMDIPDIKQLILEEFDLK